MSRIDMNQVSAFAAHNLRGALRGITGAEVDPHFRNDQPLEESDMLRVFADHKSVVRCFRQDEGELSCPTVDGDISQ